MMSCHSHDIIKTADLEIQQIYQSKSPSVQRHDPAKIYGAKPRPKSAQSAAGRGGNKMVDIREKQRRERLEREKVCTFGKLYTRKLQFVTTKLKWTDSFCICIVLYLLRNTKGIRASLGTFFC